MALPTSAGGSSVITDMIADGTGGYVLAGSFTGTLTLGSFVLTSVGDQDLFVARLTNSGQYSQAASVGGTGSESVAAVVLDANGSALITGSFYSPTINFGTITLTNSSTSSTNSDLFVARLTSAGQWSQAVRAGGPSQDSATDIALDPNGTAVVVGSFSGGAASFGSLNLTSNASFGTFFVARLTSTGVWSQAIAATGNGVPNNASSVAVDANGSAWVYGTCLDNGTLTFGNFSLTTTRGMAVFVARLNRNGTWVQLSKAASNTSVIYSAVIVLDASGNAAVTGNFRGSDVSFGTYPLVYNGLSGNSGTDNLFVARLTSAGTWTQAAQAAGSTYHSANTLALDATGNVLVTGTFRSPTITFGPTTLINSDPTPPPTGSLPTADIFLARLTTAGTWAYASQAGGLGDDSPLAVLADGSSVLLAGGFERTAASFGVLTIMSPASFTGFFARTGTVLSTSPASSNGLAPLTLAPNPATGTTTFTLAAAENARPIQLLDALSREVRRATLPAHASTLQLDLTGLTGGVYLVRCGQNLSRLVIE